jgi:hypothetical protein
LHIVVSLIVRVFSAYFTPVHVLYIVAFGPSGIQVAIPNSTKSYSSICSCISGGGDRDGKTAGLEMGGVLGGSVPADPLPSGAAGGRRHWKGDPSPLRRLAILRDASAAIELEVSPSGDSGWGDTTQTQGIGTVATQEQRLGGVTSIPSHGTTKGAEMLLHSDSATPSTL